ncbi:putative Ran GTPase binding protein, partial [Ordospora colligata]
VKKSVHNEDEVKKSVHNEDEVKKSVHNEDEVKKSVHNEDEVKKSVSEEVRSTEEGKQVKENPFLTTSVPKKDEFKACSTEEELDESSIIEKQEKFLDENQEDEVLFKAKCKLYYFAKETNSLEERAQGTMIIGKHPKTNLVRIVVFREQIGRLGCNHYINPALKAQAHKKMANGWMWMTTEDTVESDALRDKKQLLVVKFNSEEDSVRFGEEYESGRRHNDMVLEERKNKD